jgi:fumarate reductase subunit D
MVRRTEPLWWLLFAAGGSVAALLIPVLILLTGIAAPLGWFPAAFAYDRVRALVLHPLVRLGFFAVAALAFCHWGHRFRYTLAEGLALKRAWLPVAVACYAAAIAGTIWAGFVLLRP